MYLQEKLKVVESLEKESHAQLSRRSALAIDILPGPILLPTPDGKACIRRDSVQLWQRADSGPLFQRNCGRRDLSLQCILTGMKGIPKANVSIRSSPEVHYSVCSCSQPQLLGNTLGLSSSPQLGLIHIWRYFSRKDLRLRCRRL